MALATPDEEPKLGFGGSLPMSYNTSTPPPPPPPPSSTSTTGYRKVGGYMFPVSGSSGSSPPPPPPPTSTQTKALTPEQANEQKALTAYFEQNPAALGNALIKQGVIDENGNRLDGSQTEINPAKASERWEDQMTSQKASTSWGEDFQAGTMPDARGAESQDINYDYANSVEGRIAGIVDANSPLMQQAKTNALQQMASRGLLNSSIAAGASQEAVIGQAFNIANADASNWLNTEITNQQQRNNLEMFSASEYNKQAQIVYQAEQDLKKISLNIEGDSRLLYETSFYDLLRDNNKFKNDLATMEAAQNFDLEMEKFKSDYSRILQSDEYAQRLTGEYLSIIGSVWSNDQLTVEQKEALAGKMMNELQLTLGIVSSTNNIDYADLISWVGE